MVLVDVAHGKLRHIPYRDSRLTFLLQVLFFPSAFLSLMFLGYDVRLDTNQNAGFTWWKLKDNDHCKCQPFYMVSLLAFNWFSFISTHTIGHKCAMGLFFLIFFILYSCSCAAETLNTLKFAQRAKLIQNNVKVYLLPMLYGGIFLTSYFCLYIFLPSWCRLWLMKILQEMLLHCNTRYDCWRWYESFVLLQILICRKVWIQNHWVIL